MTLVVSVLFVVSMSAMIVYASGKTVVITGEEMETEEDFVLGSQSFSTTLDISTIKEADKRNAAVIHCPSMPSGESVMTAARYGEKKVYLVWKEGRDDYFLDNSPEGSMEHVKSLKISGNGTEVFFTFELDCMAEPVVSFDTRSISVDFLPVEEDEIVVAIDPVFGGSQTGVMVGEQAEKDIVLAIAKNVRKLAKDRNYRVILLRDGDYSLTQADRAKTIETIGADYYISLHLSADTEDERKYGMFAEYNGTFYRDGLSNASFADTLLKCVCESAMDKGTELVDVAGDTMLKPLAVPAAKLYLGYLSNKEEGELLSHADYRERIAKGIVEGLDEMIK